MESAACIRSGTLNFQFPLGFHRHEYPLLRAHPTTLTAAGATYRRPLAAAIATNQQQEEREIKECLWMISIREAYTLHESYIARGVAHKKEGCPVAEKSAALCAAALGHGRLTCRMHQSTVSNEAVATAEVNPGFYSSEHTHVLTSSHGPSLCATRSW